MITIDKNGNAIFPEGIKKIKNCLDFRTKKEIKTVTIPETVKKIESGAFQYCENLENITLPYGLEVIEKYAFYGCGKLRNFVMPDTIKEIQKNAFKGIRFDESVYNADKSVLFIHKDTCRSDTIRLPDSVKRIFSGAFTGKVFDEIILHEGIEQVDCEAFSDCVLCNKITVRCPTDKIKNGAFWNFRPLPEFCFAEGTPHYSRLLKMQGYIPVERVDELRIPILTPLKRYKLEKLVKECLMEKPDTMITVAEFFLKSGKGTFYKAAANFWYYRAMICGSEKAEKIINGKCNAERKALPTVAWPDIGEESGERLYALGFSSFNRRKNYNVDLPDENGIVKVTAYAGSDEVDEDGFGCEEYYDWWFLDENLKEIPGVGGIWGYSKHDKRTNEEQFKKQYDEAVKQVKFVKKIRMRMEELIEEYENENA